MRKNPEIIADNKISDSTFDKVTDGMRRVVTTGTARSAFATAKYKAAGKTGTAEVSDGADNVLFVGFAPYENPEIVVAVVIEHGASSTYAARVARDAERLAPAAQGRAQDPEGASSHWARRLTLDPPRLGLRAGAGKCGKALKKRNRLEAMGYCHRPGGFLFLLHLLLCERMGRRGGRTIRRRIASPSRGRSAPFQTPR